MTTDVAADPILDDNRFQKETLGALRKSWLLALVCIAFAAPTIVRLAQQSWTLEIGAHGPIVLLTGLWLLSRCDWTSSHEGPTERKGDHILGSLGIILSLAVYVFGRAYDFLALEAAGVFGAILSLLMVVLGYRVLIRNAFPLLYMAFLVPPPGWVIDYVTGPLQHLISYAATEILRFFDYPVMRSGVAIEVAQYRMLVEEACSGMNSILGLIAVTLFYIYILHRATWRYALVLGMLILPIAIFVNFIRVMVLILVTYHFGDAIAQGVFHNTAGMVLFALALLITFMVDAALRRVWGGGKNAD